MISNEMYLLLKSIPRFPKAVSFDVLFSEKIFEITKLKTLIQEAKHSDYEYIIQDQVRGRTVHDSDFSLTEKGQAAIESYEQNEENKKIVAKSLKVAEDSLKVAVVAKWAAIASAVTAFLALLPQLPELISFFQSLFPPIQ